MLVKKYFKRPANPRKIKMQPYDLAALALLDEYRFLDSFVLWKLLALKFPQLTWDTAKHRIFSLWANGFVDRPEEQVPLLLKQDRYHLIHCLTKRGAQLVSHHYGRNFQKTTWKVDQERANFRHLGHQITISLFRATLELSQAHEILFWLHDRQFKHRIGFQVQTEKQRQLLNATRVGERASKPIAADSFFALRINGRPTYFALEVDMDTASNKAMALKYLPYYKLLKHIDQNPMLVEKHEVKHFWVLTVCPNETHFERRGVRIRHLQEAVRTIALNDKGPSFQGHRAFLFTSQDKYRWEEPTSILNSIWQTPNAGETFSLLNLPQYVDAHKG